MQTFTADDDHTIVSLETGDLVLESVRSACEDRNIRDGAVVSAIGTLRNLNVHYLHTDELSQDRSDRNTVLELDGCWEVSGIQGLITDGDPHLHVTAFDGDRTIAGHLEEGNEVNALCEVLIRRFGDTGLTRASNEHGVSVLERR
jgi:uncharacterized protein